MDNIVKTPVPGQLAAQDIGLAEVQFEEVNARVLQVGPAARGTYPCPSVEAATHGLLHEKAADETAGAGDEDAAARFFVLHFFILHLIGST